MSGVYLFWIPRAENYGPVLSYHRLYVHHAKLAQRRWGSKVLVFLDVPYKRVLVVSRSGVAFCPSLVMSDARRSEWDETKLVRLGWLVAEMDRSDTSTSDARHRHMPGMLGEKNETIFLPRTPFGQYYPPAATYNERRTNSNETRAWLPFHREYSRRISFARPIPVLRANLPRQVNPFLHSANEILETRIEIFL